MATNAKWCNQQVLWRVKERCWRQKLVEEKGVISLPSGRKPKRRCRKSNFSPVVGSSRGLDPDPAMDPDPTCQDQASIRIRPDSKILDTVHSYQGQCLRCFLQHSCCDTSRNSVTADFGRRQPTGSSPELLSRLIYHHHGQGGVNFVDLQEFKSECC